MINFLA